MKLFRQFHHKPQTKEKERYCGIVELQRANKLNRFEMNPEREDSVSIAFDS
jgi:hypothetical protein